MLTEGVIFFKAKRGPGAPVTSNPAKKKVV